jgi:hypothetical protein
MIYIVMVNCGAENTSNFYAEGEHKRVAYSNREQAESVAAHARLTYNNDNDDDYHYGYDWSVEVVEMPVV